MLSQVRFSKALVQIWQIIFVPINIILLTIRKPKQPCDRISGGTIHISPTLQSWTQICERWGGKYLGRNTMVWRTLKNNKKRDWTKSRWRWRSSPTYFMILLSIFSRHFSSDQCTSCKRRLSRCAKVAEDDDGSEGSVEKANWQQRSPAGEEKEEKARGEGSARLDKAPQLWWTKPERDDEAFETNPCF